MNTRKRDATTQEASWIADEDAFVLKQAYKKSQIRVKEGRPKPIDLLVVTLWFVDENRNSLDTEISEADLEIADPEAVLEELRGAQLEELEKDLAIFTSLERKATNREFWGAVTTICDGTKHRGPDEQNARGVKSVSADVGKLLKSKSLGELQALEKQIRAKLSSDEPVDTDYWQSILHGITAWKAKAKLRSIAEKAAASRMLGLRERQAEAALRVREKLTVSTEDAESLRENISHGIGQTLDPEPLLKVPPDMKGTAATDEMVWFASIVRLSFSHMSRLSEY